MKLAEALSLRADLQKRVAQLKGRLKDCSKVQEGDSPAEDVNELYKELDELLAQLEGLIYRINATNIRTSLEGESLTQLIARKDVLTMRVSLMRELLEHVTEQDHRYSRHEIKMVRMIDVPELRMQLDLRSRDLRELDLAIQKLNWSVDLI